METARRRVGGFLLFYCVYLTIIVPIAMVALIVLTYAQARTVLAAFPGLSGVTMLSSALNLAVVAGSIFAGYRLWTVQPGAVRTAKLFMVLTFLINIANTYLPLAVSLPAEATAKIAAAAPIDILRALVTTVFWMSYLNKSDRVKETYAATAEPVAAL